MNDRSSAKCDASVGQPPGYYHWHRCTRKAKDGPWDGVYLCGQHLGMLNRNHFVSLHPKGFLRNEEGTFRRRGDW